MNYTESERLQLQDIELAKMGREHPDLADDINQRRRCVWAAIHEADRPSQPDSAEFIEDVLAETREFITDTLAEITFDEIPDTERAPDSGEREICPDTERSEDMAE